MSSEANYALDPTRLVPEELRRVVREQLGVARYNLAQAIEKPASGPADLAEEVHEARKSLKKLRAVARLVRNAVPSEVYQRHNTLLRDAARKLSGGRDAHVLVELFGTLTQKGLQPSSRERLAAFGQALDARAHELGELLRAGGQLAEVDASLAEAEAEVDALIPEDLRFKHLSKGLTAAYRRCRKAMKRAQADPRDEVVHEWRKTVKYVRHHVELFEPAAPELLEATEKLWHDLADHLGDHNDLAVLGIRLQLELDAQREDPAALALGDLLDLVHQRQHKLRQQALDLGRQLMAEKQGRYAGRLRAYWASSK